MSSTRDGTRCSSSEFSSSAPRSKRSAAPIGTTSYSQCTRAFTARSLAADSAARSFTPARIDIHLSPHPSPFRRGGIRSRKVDARPLLAQHCVLILVAPLALEPSVVDEVPFPAHPEPLHQRDGRSVAAIGSRDDAIELERGESEIDHGACGLGGESAVLKCGRKGVADFSDARRRPYH